MEYLNHKITEAVCAFRFDPSSNKEWDLTGFAEYYNLIKENGYSEKNELKPIQLNFQFNPKETPKNPQLIEGETQMVFKNIDGNSAILLGNNYISFHTINSYPGWEVFKATIVEKFLNIYIKMGYGKSPSSAQMIYVNNFNLKNGTSLCDYLSFVPNMSHLNGGNEISHQFISTYDIDTNNRLNIRTIFNIQQDNKKEVLLECNCLSTNNANNTCIELADMAHKNAKNSFISIITDHFKNEIK